MWRSNVVGSSMASVVDAAPTMVKSYCARITMTNREMCPHKFCDICTRYASSQFNCHHSPSIANQVTPDMGLSAKDCGARVLLVRPWHRRWTSPRPLSRAVMHVAKRAQELVLRQELYVFVRRTETISACTATNPMTRRFPTFDEPSRHRIKAIEERRARLATPTVRPTRAVAKFARKIPFVERKMAFRGRGRRSNSSEVTPAASHGASSGGLWAMGFGIQMLSGRIIRGGRRRNPC